MILTGKEFDTKSDNIAENIAIMIFSPSNSMGKERIITPVEIASSRFLNLISPFFIMPYILVREEKSLSLTRLLVSMKVTYQRRR